MADHGWQPRYTITSRTAGALMRIAEANAAVETLAWSPLVEEEIRWKARLRSTHYSTRIEGNRLTLAEAEQVVRGRSVVFAGRERDVREVDHYWHAMLRVEDWARERAPVTEELIRKLHAMVEKGPRRAPTPYRDGQNVIREAGTGAIVYLPPEAPDVPALMGELVGWVADAERAGIPAPIIAGLAHYQFVTIHPFWDGNGRTARLLATLVLHRGGLGLRGFFSLEEYHARDIDSYYARLATHPHHNYYEGRQEADLTEWVEYFTGAVAHVFTVARDEALRSAETGVSAEPPEVRRLDARARRVLALFARAETVTAADVSALLPLSDRMVRNLLAQWVEDGFLDVADASNRGRRYALAPVYRLYIGSVTAMRPAASVRPPPTREAD